MDAKEAIEHIDEVTNNPEVCEKCKQEHIQLRAWIEKQVPKEPIIKDISHYDEGSLCIHFERYCPVCKHLVESVYDYCGFC